MAPLFRNSVFAGMATLVLAPLPAFAADGEAFAERLSVVFEAQGTPLSYSNVENEGENVILNGVSIGTGETATELGTVRFENVTGSTAEGWRAERVPFDDVSDETEGVLFTADGMIIEGLTIAPPAADGAAQLTALQFERGAVDNLRWAEGDEEVFVSEGVEFLNTPAADGGFSAAFTVDRFAFNTQGNPEADGAQTTAALGYPQLTGNVAGNALWETESGELSLSPLRITVDEAGELNLAYAISGYTPAFVQSLAQLQQQMMQAPEDQNAGIAITGLLSQLSIDSAEIAYTDNSLADRLLDYYAEQNNQSREELIEQLLATLPALLGGGSMPEFEQQLTSAAETFLNDPQSISIAIDPAEPIPATQVLGAVVAAPQSLPSVLQLRVTANE